MYDGQNKLNSLSTVFLPILFECWGILRIYPFTTYKWGPQNVHPTFKNIFRPKPKNSRKPFIYKGFRLKNFLKFFWN